MPIDIVLPVSKSDEARREPFLKALKAFGPYHTSNILIVPTTEVMEKPDWRVWMNDVTTLFNHAVIEPLPNTPMGGWPKAPNEHFSWANRYQERHLPNSSWLWLELDCTPLKKGWLDDLDYEFRLGGRPYLGYIGQAHEGRKYPDGTITQVPLEKHMEGVAIYPPNHARSCVLVHSYSHHLSFDVYCRFYTTARGDKTFCTPSQKIIHKWRTTNYRIEGGKLFCDDVTPPQEAILSHAGEVNLAGKVLHHGDKGSSLVDLVVAHGGVDNLPLGAVAQRTEQEPSKLKVEGSSPSSAAPELTELIPGVFYRPDINPEAALQPVLEAWGYSKFPGASPRTSNPEPGVNVAQPDCTPVISGAFEGAKVASEEIHTQPAPVSDGAQTFPSAALIEATLESSDKKLRLKEVMQRLGIPDAQKGAFQKHLIAVGFRATAPAYWVLKAA